MSYPVALYCAVHDSETKITIPVFRGTGIWIPCHGPGRKT